MLGAIPFRRRHYTGAGRQWHLDQHNQRRVVVDDDELVRRHRRQRERRIADFSTLNITADDTVHLDSARTIGGLKFGDTTPSNNWILDNNGNAANVLTLAVSSGSPTITVNNDTATMNLALAGTQGFTKGAGELLLMRPTHSPAAWQSTPARWNSAAAALGSTSNAVSVTAGATLDLGGQASGANPLSISGTGVGGNGALVNSSASPASFAGTIIAAGPFSVGGSGDITLSGSVNFLFRMPLTKIGNDTLTLSGSTDNRFRGHGQQRLRNPGQNEQFWMCTRSGAA